MAQVWTVYRREMRAALVSPIPYVLTCLFVAWMAVWFFHLTRFFVEDAATMDAFFRAVPLTFVVLVAALTMRLWSDEFRGGTVETLMTLPVRARHLVLGKFLGAWTLLAICLVATLPVAFTVDALGELDWGPVIGGYLGTLFLGAGLLAMGLWISALTGHQIVAFLVTAVAGLALVLIGWMSGEIGGDLGAFFQRLSLGSRFQAMGRGVIDLRDLLYFVTFGVFFLYLCAQAVDNRRYK